MGSTRARPFPIPAPVAKNFYGLQKDAFRRLFCVLYSFGDFVSAACPLGLSAGKFAPAVGLAVQTIFPRKRDGPLIAALFLKIRGQVFHPIPLAQLLPNGIEQRSVFMGAYRKRGGKRGNPFSWA